MGAPCKILAAEAVTFGLTAAGSVGAGNIDVVCHTGIRLVVRTLLHAAGYRRFGVAVAFCIFHYEHSSLSQSQNQ
jgi:hypothetical protein